MRHLAFLALVAFVATQAAGEPISKRPGYLYQHRKRLGHFKEQPYIDLYKTYAAAFVLPLYKDRSHDDYRSFTPSGEECIVYFQQFRTNKYKVSQIDQLILLDACLGYLYESTYHELDKSESELVAQKIDTIVGDKKLRELYDGTQIDQLGKDAKECIANLLMSSVMMRNQFNNDQCNSHWIQLFLQFAACHHKIPQELRKTDTYVSTVYDIVRDEAQMCFEAEKKALSNAVRKYYSNDYMTRFKNKIVGRVSKNLQRQQGERMWPKPIVKLLKVVQDAKKEISLRQVHQLLRGYYLDDPKLKPIFLHNIARYASSVIKPKNNDKSGDPTGAVRYQDRVVNGLCNFFRSADSDSEFDFATSFIRLVRLLNHEDVFEISFEEFITQILTHAEETASMYLSLSACNILTYTEGHFSTVGFTVVPKADDSDMVRWPVAGFY